MATEKETQGTEDNLLGASDGKSAEPGSTDNVGGDHGRIDTGGSETIDSDGTDATTGNGGDDDDAGDESQSASQKRTAQYIKRLKREKREAEKAAEQARAELAGMVKKVTAPEKPARADYDDDEAYLDAMVAYKLTIASEKEAPATELPGVSGVLVKAGFAKADAEYIAESFDEITKTHKDFMKVVMKANNVTREVFEGLLEVDDPGAVMHHLATNQEELTRIAKLGNARSIAVQLGRLEERLQTTGGGSNKPRQVSHAPEPVEVLDANRDREDVSASDRISDADYFKRENKRLLKSRGFA